jgi:hypothetical protein
VGVAGGDDPGVGHQQGPLKPVLFRQGSRSLGGLPSEDRPRPNQEIERDHREVNSITR